MVKATDSHVRDGHLDHADWQIFVDEKRRPVRCRGLFNRDNFKSHAAGARAHFKHIRDGLSKAAERTLADDGAGAAEKESAQRLLSELENMEIEPVKKDEMNYPVVDVTGKAVCSNFVRVLLEHVERHPQLRVDLMDNGTLLPASRFPSLLVIGDEEMEVPPPASEIEASSLAAVRTEWAMEMLASLHPDDGTLLRRCNWQTNKHKRMVAAVDNAKGACRVAALLHAHQLIDDKELERVREVAAHVWVTKDKHVALDIFVEVEKSGALEAFLKSCQSQKNWADRPAAADTSATRFKQ